MQIAFKRVHVNAILPSYQSELASGFDLHACLDEELVLLPGQRVLVPIGFQVQFPNEMELQIRPRSGLAYKNGITVVNTPGTVDADYRGEVKVLLINHSDIPFTIRNGDRIAQGVLQRVERLTIAEWDELNQTDRGSGGFGSTGV